MWRGWLDWAMASDRLADAVEAARHLPADGLEPEALLSHRAWLAARVGDPRAERIALQQWLEHVPGEPQAVARWIALAAQSGRVDEVAELRRRKAELDRASDAYRMALTSRGVPTDRFDELGRLAETLGRWFEARGWWTLALSRSTHADEARAAIARIDRAEQALESIGPLRSTTSSPRALADALADLISSS